MARKVKKLPDGVVLIHYSKNGKIVSDLKLEDWFSNLVNIIVRTRKINKTLIVKVGTENMVHITRNLVTREILPPDMIRYRYGRRIFRIDAQGHWVGSPGKQLPKNFLGLTNKVRGKFLGQPDMFVRVPSNKKPVETPDTLKEALKEAYKGLTSQEKIQNEMEASMLTGFYSSGSLEWHKFEEAKNKTTDE